MPITVSHQPDAAAIVMPAYAAGAAQAAARNNAQALQWAQLGSSNYLKQQQMAQSAAAQNQEAALKQQQLGLSARGQMIDAQMKQQQLGQSGLRDMLQMGLAYGQAYDNSALRWAGLNRDFSLQKMREEQQSKMQAAQLDLARERMTQQDRQQMAKYDQYESALGQAVENGSIRPRDADLLRLQFQQSRMGILSQAAQRSQMPWDEPPLTPQEQFDRDAKVLPDGSYALPGPDGKWQHIKVDKPPRDLEAEREAKQQEAAAKEQQRQKERMEAEARRIATTKEGGFDQRKYLKTLESLEVAKGLSDPTLPPLPPQKWIAEEPQKDGKTTVGGERPERVLSPKEELAARLALKQQQEQEQIRQAENEMYGPAEGQPGMQAGTQQAPQQAAQQDNMFADQAQKFAPILKAAQGKPEAKAIEFVAKAATTPGDWASIPDADFERLKAAMYESFNYAGSIPEETWQRFYDALKRRGKGK